LPIRSRMISVIIGYNSLVEEYRCRRNKWVSRASVPRGRKVWIFCELKTPFAKIIAAASPANRIHKLWHGPMAAHARLISRDNPVDLSVSRDSPRDRMVISMFSDTLYALDEERNVPG
jgi:hypothetical protein